MSLSDTLLQEGFTAQLSVSGESFIVISGAAAGRNPFSGVLETLPGIDPRLDLGSDIRELACLHVIRDSCPAVDSQDQIQEVSQSTAPIWKVVRREDNPSDVVVKLWIVKVLTTDT